MSLPTVACKRCGEQIAWVRTEASQHPMPIDPDPNEDGNVFVRYVNRRPIAAVSSKATPRPPGVAFMPHFATCVALNRGKVTPKPKRSKPVKVEPPSLMEGE